MPRSLKKGPFVDLSLSKKVDEANANNDKKPIKIDYDLKKEKIRVKEKISFILKKLFNFPKIVFSKLFNRKSKKNDVVVTFIAILELIQNRKIKVTQKNNFDEILIEKLNIK